MAFRRTGALIVIEQNQRLDDYIKDKAVILDANISQKLLLTIFNTKTLLHDGAVIIRNNRIYAARVVLPNAPNINMNEAPYGTRHVAGIGLSEITDAFVIIISEERGKISIAKEGKLFTDLKNEELSKEIKDALQS